MKAKELAVLGILAASTWAQSPRDTTRQYGGRWWASADPGERAGFINGASDCLTWTAHLGGFNATPEQISQKIDRFYKSHPDAGDFAVIDAWAKVESKRPALPESNRENGEKWTNAHWYLNGDWWGQIGVMEEQGFLEGYLWCVDNRVQPKTAVYSRSVSFYQGKIDAYVTSHPKIGTEAIADTLYRLRDGASNGIKSSLK